MQGDDDEAWQAIVENFGERAVLDEAEPAARTPIADSDSSAEPEEPGHARELIESDEAFVPPDPAPMPFVPPDRMLAWAGVFGAPAVLLVAILLRIDLPDLVGWGLIAAFVGGFGYLVARWPTDPRDPWDDGAQV